jgi:hypothetical protein
MTARCRAAWPSNVGRVQALFRVGLEFSYVRIVRSRRVYGIALVKAFAEHHGRRGQDPIAVGTRCRFDVDGNLFLPVGEDDVTVCLG